ncbi:hypothetical protein [Microseira sp. BLCC-F43]|uniref:hypothetical protein n=1 Tax=Microseira sp. BLCC-F43 TaxID=3153602 RepID=UPI0035B994E1
MVPTVATSVIPSVMGTVAMIKAIATMLLSSFSLSGLSTAGVSALAYATTATALKVLGSTGANACRYLCAGALKAIPVTLIPRVFSHTKMFAGAWSFIGAWSLPIIIAAIIIVSNPD